MSYEPFYSSWDVISLFSETNGFDIGLQQAGLKVVMDDERGDAENGNTQGS